MIWAAYKLKTSKFQYWRMSMNGEAIWNLDNFSMTKNASKTTGMFDSEIRIGLQNYNFNFNFNSTRIKIEQNFILCCLYETYNSMVSIGFPT